MESNNGGRRNDDYDSDEENMQSATRHAERNAGSSGSADMFSSIISSLAGNKQSVAQQPIDEQRILSLSFLPNISPPPKPGIRKLILTRSNQIDAVKSHQQFFGNSSEPQAASSSSMGSAAAMQALKMFTGGSSSGNTSSGQQSNSQNAFVGMAMAQASKLFDNQAAQGNVASGEKKESAVQQAGEMALKMYLQSGGKSGGGSGGLMGLASKFL